MMAMQHLQAQLMNLEAKLTAARARVLQNAFVLEAMLQRRGLTANELDRFLASGAADHFAPGTREAAAIQFIFKESEGRAKVLRVALAPPRRPLTIKVKRTSCFSAPPHSSLLFFCASTIAVPPSLPTP